MNKDPGPSQYRETVLRIYEFHYKDKTISWPSYFYNGSLERPPLYFDGARGVSYGKVSYQFPVGTFHACERGWSKQNLLDECSVGTQYAFLQKNTLAPMMTSSNGTNFRVTGPLCWEFTGPGEFPAQRPVTRSFDVYFDLRLNKRLSKQSWGWWFETQSCPLWRHCNAN